MSRQKRTVSVLFNEPKLLKSEHWNEAGITWTCFSALQRAEIAEITTTLSVRALVDMVSVLFNEPKLLKYVAGSAGAAGKVGFSALQRAEIAEIMIGLIPI